MLRRNSILTCISRVIAIVGQPQNIPNETWQIQNVWLLAALVALPAPEVVELRTLLGQAIEIFTAMQLFFSCVLLLAVLSAEGFRIDRCLWSASYVQER
jgi:hypothetical protein